MIYRFRSTEKLLSEKHAELENQYLYFAPAIAQNDPVEGYVDYFWSGDSVAWMGLFKHYVWQLYFAIERLLIGTKIEDIKHLFLYNTEIHLQDTKFPEIRKQLEKDFSDDEWIKELAAHLGKINMKISREQLVFILSMIQKKALFYCNRMFENEGIPIFQTTMFFRDVEYTYSQESKHSFFKSIETFKTFPETIEAYSATRNSLFFINYMTFAEADEALRKNCSTISFLLVEFPEIYSNRITSLSFSDWYTVCFNETYNNPTMWSHYADNHKGVCLIFNNDTSTGMELSPLSKESREEKRIFPIKQIKYNNAPPRVNFFSTLGMLWGDEREHWLKHNGTISNTLTEIFCDVEKWRDFYWRENENRFLRKNDAWKNEQEVRIIITDAWYVHNTPDLRKYKYNFSNLDGIIFGINTPTDEKFMIVKILQEKCNKHNREKFNIYQAKYNVQKGEIEKELFLTLQCEKNN